MKLPRPFYRLPITLDAERLQAEVASLPAEAWVVHPKAVLGNSAVRLITVDGADNDLLYGQMLATKYLRELPYVRQVLATFKVVWSRSRLMRLAPGAGVPEHADINHHWFNRVRVHMPVITNPHVMFTCGGESVHMAAGEAWIFDNWRLHRVDNPTPFERIHLVADTTGTADFWKLALSSKPDVAPIRIVFDPIFAGDVETERNPNYVVMPPVEVEVLLRDLAEEVVDAADPSPRSNTVSAYRELLDDFVLDWRQLYLRHGEDCELLDPYLRRREELRRRSTDLGAGLSVRTNGISVHSVLADRVLRQLLRLADVPRPEKSERHRLAYRRSTRSQFFRPIFIVSAPRAGSTLLYETLAVNSSFCNLGGEAHWLVENNPSLRPGAPGVDSNRLTAEQCTDQIAEQLAESALRRATLSTGAPVGLSAVGLRLLEKTPKNSLRIPFFARAFPDARFIFLWRDPRENIASIMEAWRTTRWVTYPRLSGWDGPWSFLLPPGWRDMRGKSLEEIAAFQWQSTNQIVLEDLHQLSSERWTVVNYSDFLTTTKETVTALCTFCDVEMDDPTTARVSAPLPLSRYTQTRPQPGKWRQNEAAITKILSRVSSTWDELSALAKISARDTLSVDTGTIAEI